jgi:hypothetical protein
MKTNGQSLEFMIKKLAKQSKNVTISIHELAIKLHKDIYSNKSVEEIELILKNEISKLLR